MKKTMALALIATAIVLMGSTQPVRAADDGIVKVALTDMSSSMGMGANSQSLMGQGMMWPGMMGQGMMGSGMMGQGLMMGFMAIRVDHDSIKAGPIKFEVTNWSRGMLHEMLIVAVDNANVPLPYDYAKAKVAEDQVKIIADTSELAPNVSRVLDVNLTPGSYLLICNVAGHYGAGMATPFKVVP